MPDLELADDLKKTVCLRAGGTLRLMVFVTGRPLPVVAWRKSGVELQSRGFIETTDSYTSLMVEKVTRYDSGKYVVEAENPSGKKTATILVKVYGTQGKPQPFQRHGLVLCFLPISFQCLFFFNRGSLFDIVWQTHLVLLVL